MISWGDTAHRIRCGWLWFGLNNLPTYYCVVLFFPEASQPSFLLQFHLYLKSHLSYHSLSHPWILTLRAALHRGCFPQEVSWLNAMTNYCSYLKAVAAVFNFTVSSYSVLLKCQHSPAAFCRGRCTWLTCKHVLFSGRGEQMYLPPKDAPGTCCRRWSAGCQEQSLWAGWSFTRRCVYRAWNEHFCTEANNCLQRRL